jgi:hypothetical protein
MARHRNKHSNSVAFPHITCLRAATVQSSVRALLELLGRRRKGSRLPLLRRVNWKYVFMCMSDLTSAFPFHTCTQTDACGRFTAFLGCVVATHDRLRVYDARATSCVRDPDDLGVQ